MIVAHGFNFRTFSAPELERYLFVEPNDAAARSEAAERHLSGDWADADELEETKRAAEAEGAEADTLRSKLDDEKDKTGELEHEIEELEHEIEELKRELYELGADLV